MENKEDKKKNLVVAEQNSFDDESEEEIEGIRMNLPKKSKYRMRAHCNPLSEITIKYPISPKCVDWSINYPKLFNKSTKENAEIYNNTLKYPITYTYDDIPESTSSLTKENKIFKSVNILDVGCGYGGLLYNMAPHLGPEDLAMGMEIRDRVSNFVGDKIKSLRVNSGHNQYNNIAVLRTNTMKLLLNYFYKEQLDKIFFCFPDPHFKKYNHRKRIVNKYLLNDYAYVLKYGGKVYTITDVEELHNWHVETLDSHPCFKRLTNEEIGADMFIDFMKNTDEARKVIKKGGSMFWAVYERTNPKISSIQELIKLLKH